MLWGAVIMIAITANILTQAGMLHQRRVMEADT